MPRAYGRFWLFTLGRSARRTSDDVPLRPRHRDLLLRRHDQLRSTTPPSRRPMTSTATSRPWVPSPIGYDGADRGHHVVGVRALVRLWPMPPTEIVSRSDGLFLIARYGYSEPATPHFDGVLCDATVVTSWSQTR
jgi:hypothetical protein